MFLAMVLQVVFIFSGLVFPGIFVFVMGVSGYGGHGVRGHGVLLVKLYCS